MFFLWSKNLFVTAVKLFVQESTQFEQKGIKSLPVNIYIYADNIETNHKKGTFQNFQAKTSRSNDEHLRS